MSRKLNYTLIDLYKRRCSFTVSSNSYSVDIHSSSKVADQKWSKSSFSETEKTTGLSRVLVKPGDHAKMTDLVDLRMIRPLGFMFLGAVVCTLVGDVQSYVRQDLSGSGWTVTENTTGVKVAGKVPGSMFTALSDQGVIPDPLYRDNDVKFAWPALTDWTYSRSFSVPAELIATKQAWLVCEGLDTVATVVVNGKVVGQSSNMFVRSAFNVTGVLQGGENLIAVNFKSAVNEALALVNRSDYVIPPECPTQAQNGQCHVNQIRKEQCSFSWDWGPSFPTQGIWKPIYLEFYNSAVIREVSADVRKVNLQWQVYIDIVFDVDVAAAVNGHLNVALADLNVTLSQDVTVSPSNNSVTVVLSVPTTTSVPLWWPNGHGNQPLFGLSVSFTSGQDTTEKLIQIGFRTVELIQDPVSNRTEDGLTFYFRVNGYPIFLKGSNWIPGDSFQERITEDLLEYLLGSAANVSINVLRVWGGGVYESEEFYQLCDKLGILIWQDIMFSVATYPVYPEFLQSVSVEVRQQVRRLKHHPSILVWAGNNENEAALRQNWFGTSGNFTRYYNDYVQLYVKVIGLIVGEEDPTRSYLTSSPSNGKDTVSEGYIAQDPGSEFYGDIHFYDYSVDQWNASSFKIPRMASEYGVQSWCNNETLAKVFIESDFSMDSAMVNHRQHHPGGNVEMELEVGIHLNLPNSSDVKANFINFIYLTQINQAMSMRTQSEHYRRYQTQLLPDGRGATMGALYWQLNDVWQAPTWASIDYAGSWKMLHYFVKSFFSKQLVSPFLRDNNTLDVFMVVDDVPVREVRTADGKFSFQPVTKVADLKQVDLPAVKNGPTLRNLADSLSGNLTVSIYSYSSFQSLFSWRTSFSMMTVAESVFTRPVSDLLTESGCPSLKDCVLSLTSTDLSGSVTSTSWLALAYPKFSNLLPANVQIASVTQISLYEFNIHVSADAIALFVWLSTDDIAGHFSDNGFLMLTPVLDVQFIARELVSVGQLSSQLNIRSLVDSKS